MSATRDPRLPACVYSAAQVREIDRIAIEQHGIAGYELMQRAARAALSTVLVRWPAARRLVIFCGAGNNAGDGYVLARLARARGFAVRVVAVGEPDALHGDAALAWRDFSAVGGTVESAAQPSLEHCDLVIDALLGTGLDRALEGDYARTVAMINAAGLPVLALDVPTGLDADSGQVHGVAVHASATITFVGLKQGLFLGVAPDYCGELEFAGLGIPAEAAAEQQPPLKRLLPGMLQAALPARARTAHKGSSGRLLLIGGAPGTAGAIRLAAEAALRAGAGLVYVATHPDSIASVMAGRPELMCHGVQGVEDIASLLTRVDAAVIGPGLGQTQWGLALWRRVLASDLPLVVDADGLNTLAQSPQPRGNWILTPHPGEAARLLGIGIEAVQAHRRAAVVELAQRYKAVAVLKGACSLVATASGEDVTVCDRGNPGMASAGMGDVLAGVLGGLLVQCRDLSLSAQAGVLLHAMAGDAAAVDGERGTVASDLMPHIRRCANPS